MDGRMIDPMDIVHSWKCLYCGKTFVSNEWELIKRAFAHRWQNHKKCVRFTRFYFNVKVEPIRKENEP